MRRDENEKAQGMISADCRSAQFAGISIRKGIRVRGAYGLRTA